MLSHTASKKQNLIMLKLSGLEFVISTNLSDSLIVYLIPVRGSQLENFKRIQGSKPTEPTEQEDLLIGENRARMVKSSLVNGRLLLPFIARKRQALYIGNNCELSSSTCNKYY